MKMTDFKLQVHKVTHVTGKNAKASAVSNFVKHLMPNVLHDQITQSQCGLISDSLSKITQVTALFIDHGQTLFAPQPSVVQITVEVNSDSLVDILDIPRI